MLICPYCHLPYSRCSYWSFLLIDFLKKKWLLALVPLGGAIVFFSLYAHHLKEIGKLYLGDQDGFVVTTVHSLTEQFFKIGSPFIDYFVVVISLGMIGYWLYKSYKSREVWSTSNVYPFYFTAAISSIILQHVVLGVNYPHSRAALFLIIFFLGTLVVTLDTLSWRHLMMILTVLFSVLFIMSINFRKSQYFYYEHFDKQLLTNIPSKAMGIPPSTGGRFWEMDGGRSQSEGYPVRAFQEIAGPQDTLYDYIITTASKNPMVIKGYNPKFEDPVSQLTLFERKNFMPRVMVEEASVSFDNSKRYNDVFVGPYQGPGYLRFYGTIRNMSIFKNVQLVVSAERDGKSLDFNRLPLTESAKINVDGEITFDVTFRVKTDEPDLQLKVYLWNKYEHEVSGTLGMEYYLISR